MRSRPATTSLSQRSASKNPLVVIRKILHADGFQPAAR